ncbi:baseplate hub protein [Burkholderia glumae]|uniref:baseplate hub protein n=1 Tax=Burkholderia glumae TaxID=337 RepID=UPI00021785E0|nr:hypothetical protein [Burkholderia glumae]ACR29227.2 Hypothetical protein bglu_1g21210 [Burkholderia glumae BGR1]UVS95643.1 hypothetical protein EFP19_07590 [Burkholderia glumae]
MSFTRKRIDVTIQLGTGQFGDTGSSKVTITGLRVQALLNSYGSEAMSDVQARIYGLPLSMINQLTTVGPINTAYRNNTLELAAGDDEHGMSVVYSGTIGEAWGDFAGAPEVALNVIGWAGLFQAVKPVGASSYLGSVDAATVMQDLANMMGLAFENNGVSVQLAYPYFPGTALAQVRACARAADINYSIERGTLAIWPRNGARAGDIPTISTATGMVGYPRFTSKGIAVQCEFNRSIRQGGQVKVESILQVASGTWNVFGVTHALESETPNGSWYTTFEGFPQNGE